MTRSPDDSDAVSDSELDSDADLVEQFRDAASASPTLARAALDRLGNLAGRDGGERTEADRLDRPDQGGEFGPGDFIGTYELLERVGAGGMGIVFRARQLEPLQREVALKIVRGELGGVGLRQRFEFERQSLARMNHPGIARLFDAGTTRDGRLFFTMEFVDGEPLTDYCDARRLGLTRRLRLFQQLCRAVQHAHQRGLLHRDLKPSNVLVVPEGDAGVEARVKVIDFGLARSLERHARGARDVTLVGTPLGTLGYMSPEQAGLGDAEVDTRTDVYSLGVILYRLLTGTLPFATSGLSKAPLDEALRILREDPPARPSSRVASHAAIGRPADLRGDLDWIVLRALEKVPDRRYASAADLAADVDRAIRHVPVLARAPTLGYRWSRLWRRRRNAILFASIAGLALAMIGASALRYRWRTEVERSGRVAAGESASRTQKFLTQLLSSSMRRGEDVARTSLVDVIRVEAGGLADHFKDQPYTEVIVRDLFARTLHDAGFVDEARDQYEAALTLHAKIAADGLPEWGDPDDAIKSRRVLRLNLARIYQNEGRDDEAEALLAAALADAGDGRDAADVDVREQVVCAYAGLAAKGGRLDDAIDHLRRFMVAERAGRPADRVPLPEASHQLGRWIAERGEVDEAVALLRHAIESTPSEASGRRLGIRMRSLAEVLMGAGRFSEAESTLAQSVELLRASLGASHRRTKETAALLAEIRSGRNEEEAPTE